MADKQNKSAKKPSLPQKLENVARKKFAAIECPEIDEQKFVAQRAAAFEIEQAIQSDPALAYAPQPIGKTPCGNGDFEDQLDPAEWDGASGNFPMPNASSNPPGETINYSGLMSGLSGGAIGSGSAHHTHVTAGIDPTLSAATPSVSMPTTAQGSSGAVRIGNTVNGAGCELISKTFTVSPTQSMITFWYAAVFQDPGHSYNQQPFFSVRVTDASGAIVPGAFDFGNSSDKLVAESPATNPFFAEVTSDRGQTIVYKDWSCAQIDLSSKVGEQVTIEFITADCAQGGHWGYAYIDNFCGDCAGSPTGDLRYDCQDSTHCGPGKICFAYDLPEITPAAAAAAGIPPSQFANAGEITITLDLYQNGTKVGQLVSPTLNDGNNFCFDIDPATIAGLDQSLEGFDLVATGDRSLAGINLGQTKIGSAPDGMNLGQNNDYKMACKSCSDTVTEQNHAVNEIADGKQNILPSKKCDCPGNGPITDDCTCDCEELKLPKIEPCISVKWGDSECDCLETDDVEVLTISVSNCYSNVTLTDVSIGKILVTEMDGTPVPVLPDGTPSVMVVPSGPVCFGDVGPCSGGNEPGRISREIVLQTRGAVGRDYRLSFEGVCYSVTHHLQTSGCFVMKLCQD